MRHFTIQIQGETLLPKLDEPCISFEEQKKELSGGVKHLAGRTQKI